MDINKLTVTFSLSELKAIVNTMNRYAALHISTDYEAEAVAERLENFITAVEVEAYN